MNIQRQFGKLTIKGGGNDAKVQVLLSDFEQADKCLAQLIDAVKQWRDAWREILTTSLGIASEYESLYNPIVGATDGHSRNNYETSDEQLRKTARLKEAYGELKTDLLEEVNMMDERIIRPATDAREFIKPMKKVIKKRDDKRLDFERYQDRVNTAAKKTKKTEREEQTYARAQEDLSKATDSFQVADEHIRTTLPPLIQACFSLLPHLLAAQIMTQNTLLAQYYTILHTYCGEEGFPSPPPSMEQVISIWDSAFKPVKAEAEAITLIARGKAVHAPMQLGDDPRKGNSISGLNLRNNLAQRRTSGQTVPTISSNQSSTAPGRIARIPSSNSSSSAIARREEYDQDDSNYLSTGPAANFASRPPSGPGHDYFQMKPTSDRRASPASHDGSPATTPGSSSALTASIVNKKKPPPPPPKRIGSAVKETWVVALYSFDGQEQGDLSFQEGEKIKVIKKTGSTDDWWEGELRGARGKFPANYCEVVA